MAAKQKIMRRVVRTVGLSPFVHFYLACGHMITMREEDLEENSPSSIECWACEEENKKGIADKVVTYSQKSRA